MRLLDLAVGKKTWTRGEVVELMKMAVAEALERRDVDYQEKKTQALRAAADQASECAKELAPLLRAFFDSLEKSKFTSQQALYLTGRYLVQMLGGNREA